MPSVGPVYATTAADQTGGGWSSPAAVAASDDSRASFILPPGETTSYLRCEFTTGFAAIPDDAMIVSLSVTVERQCVHPEVVDNAVYVTKTDAGPAGTNASKGAVWAAGTDEFATFTGGGLWGQAWTAAEIKNGVYVYLRAQHNDALSVNTETALIDSVAVLVTYVLPVTGRVLREPRGALRSPRKGSR